MKDALGHGSNSHGDAAADKVGKMFRLNSHTHEVVSPGGEVVARLRIGKNDGVAVDERGMGQISRSGGTALHDAVAMEAYRAKGNSFSADRIGGELHYLTGNDFAGHTVRPVNRVRPETRERTGADLLAKYRGK